MYYPDNGWYVLKMALDIVILTFQYALLPFFIYHFIISIFGWVKRKEESAKDFAPVNSFAMIVAAHNEEMVIGNIVRNLKSLNYPKDLYDIFVIADNCTDDTAKIGRENGAMVFERFNHVQRGKGYALKWMFDQLFQMEKKYSAVCVLDADNLVSANYLMEMNKQLCKGYDVVQGYLDSKNPNDSLISASYSLTYWINNRLFQLPRYYLGISCAIGGTGFIVSTDTLKEIGWDATCLTEDLEFTLKLALSGKKAYWSHEAVVYDEKPLRMAESWKQRKRWMQGQADCTSRYLKDLINKAMRDKSMVAFDCAVYLIQPFIIVMNGIAILFNFLRFILFIEPEHMTDPGTLLTTFLLLLTTYFTIIFVYAEGKLTRKIFMYFLAFPIYNLTWIPIIIQGFLNKDDRVWVHTKHTRAIEIKEIEELEKV